MMRKLLRRLFRKKGELFSVKVLKTNDNPIRIELDGENIADRITGFEYRINNTEIPKVTLTFPCKVFELESDAELSDLHTDTDS